MGQVDQSWYDYLQGIQQPSTAPNAVDWSTNTGVFVPISPATPIVTPNGNITVNPVSTPATPPSGIPIQGIVPFADLPVGYDIAPPTENYPTGIFPRVGVNVPNPELPAEFNPITNEIDWTWFILLMLLMDKGG